MTTSVTHQKFRVVPQGSILGPFSISSLHVNDELQVVCSHFFHIQTSQINHSNIKCSYMFVQLNPNLIKILPIYLNDLEITLFTLVKVK